MRFIHETIHDTANRTMTFVFHMRLQVVINFAQYEILIVKDDEVIIRENVMGERFSLTDLENILRQANEAAETIDKRKLNK